MIWKKHSLRLQISVFGIDPKEVLSPCPRGHVQGCPSQHYMWWQRVGATWASINVTVWWIHTRNVTIRSNALSIYIVIWMYLKNMCLRTKSKTQSNLHTGTQNSNTCFTRKTCKKKIHNKSIREIDHGMERNDGREGKEDT